MLGMSPSVYSSSYSADKHADVHHSYPGEFGRVAWSILSQHDWIFTQTAGLKSLMAGFHQKYFLFFPSYILSMWQTILMVTIVR